MKKCNGTILFNISNEQKDYAQCMEILMHIKEKSDDMGRSAMINSMRLFPNSRLNVETVKDMESENSVGKMASVDELQNIRIEEHNILFKVYCNDDENDIVNLQFFFLIKKWLMKELGIESDRVGLYIKTTEITDQGKISPLYFKAAEFLTYQCGKGRPYFADYAGKGKYIGIRTLIPRQNVILRKFSPLIEIISSQDIGVEYWQQSVSSFFKRCEKMDIIWEKIECFSVLEADRENICNRIKDAKDDVLLSSELYEIKNDVEKKIQKQREKCSNRHYRLMLTLKECFCTNKVSVARKRMELCNSLIFVDTVKEMTLMSFYIFCLFEYHSTNNQIPLDYTEDNEALYQIVLKMRDIGDGFGQLMLNTIEHSNFGEGYFFFRIHDKSDKGYLKSKYTKYMDSQKESTDFFLEMNIIDYSTLNVPDKFMKNMEARAGAATDENDKKIFAEVMNEKHQINLSTFFRPDERETQFWEKYYKISDNIVHHYGLQLFDSVIESNEGCFLAVSMPECQIKNSDRNVYCSFDAHISFDGEYYIPGTQYSALLPLRHVEKIEYTAVNADIDYTGLLNESFKAVQLEGVSDREIEEIIQNYKRSYGENGTRALPAIIEKTIIEISEGLVSTENNNIESTYRVYYCDIGETHHQVKYLEIFCKILIRFIFKKLEKEKVYIALLNCDDKHIIEITRILTIFYNKQGKSPLFDNVQIYLSGINPENAFLFAGNNIASVLNRAERLAIACGIQPGCITILTNMLQRKAMNCAPEDESNSAFSVVPFELLEYGDKEILFKEILNNILQNDIRKIKTGCKIKNTHVRLGSKIHLTEFYQAEILFQNNYFTARFAYIIAEDIYKEMKDKKNLVLVGYETYSEMLSYEIVEQLKNNYGMKNISYIIYEQKNGERFRYIQELKEEENYFFVYIVPINSTLTTHNKMQAALKRDREDASQVAGNYGIILFCPEDDNNGDFKEIREDYGWKKINGMEITTSLVEGEKVKCFFRTEVEWKRALECECCFPSKKYDKEQPLIETNKASIIPMQKLELLENSVDCNTTNRENYKEELQRVKDLGQCMIYSHVERNGNHFNYYFQMGKFFRKNKEKIVKWLRKIEIEKNTKNDRIIFNVIVAPQHYSNNGFVTEVNKHVFQNASLVLDIEVNKEFRSNIKAKYSNLLLLYNNLEKCSRKSEICFHFVDDTIVSGTTFYRAKSIIRSIFPRQLGKCVKVTIFKSVILMLNRSSSFSRMNYHENNFYAYVNLEISSLRTQEDACVLCNIVKDAEKMKEMSATQEMSRYWDERRIYHTCRNTKEVNLSEISEEKRERARRRLICSHKANVILNAKIHNRGDESEIKKCILEELLCIRGKMRTEWQLSYIKVLSRPFFSFSSVIRKAMFEIMLQLLDYMLGNKSLKEDAPEMKRLLEDIDKLEKDKNCRMLYVLLLTLIKRLSDLGSTFIIRKENIERILTYYKTVECGDRKKDFLLKYRACIKKLISLSGDEIKATWLEYLLINEKEYYPVNNTESSNSLPADIRYFYDMLYMENTVVFRDAVWDLTKEKRNEIELKVQKYKRQQGNEESRLEAEDLKIENRYDEVSTVYYYKNFKMIYDWNFKGNSEILDAVCYLYIYLLYGDHLYTDIKEYYNKLAEILKKSTQAKCVQIIVCDDAKEPNLLGDSEAYVNENCVREELKGIIEKDEKYVDNSYYVPKDGRVGILRFGREVAGNRNSERDVYLGFAFEANDKRKAIMRLRNVLIFRNEFVHKFEEDFGTDAIQQFLVSMNQNKLLTGSGTIDHSYAKTRAQFLEDSLYIVSKWEDKVNKDVLKDIKDQVGFLYVTVSHTIISRLFQKAVVGKYDGADNTVSIEREWLNTTILGETENFNLYERDELSMCGGNNFKKCNIKIEKGVNLEKYYTYSTGDFTLSAIFILLAVNTGKHSQSGDVDIKVSVGQGTARNGFELIFSNFWDGVGKDLKSKINLIKAEINKPNHDSSQGITLWTLNKYFRYHTRNKETVERGIEIFLTKKSNEHYFNVSIPIYK